MEYARLGHSGIEVSKVCVGGMSFGKVFPDFHQWVIGADETREVIARALEQGVNFIDTATTYAHGTSEEFLGNALRAVGVKREDVIIASKVYFNDGKLSRSAIEREISGTLTRLGTDYLDLYQIHRFDYDTPVEETMSALDALVKSGKVRALGASAMYGYQFHNLQIVAEQNGLTKFSTLQNHYNLLYREDERELIPVAEQYGGSRMPYAPLAGGHLTHPEWDSGTKRDTTDKILHRKYDREKENNIAIVKRVEELASRRGVTMSEIALAWHFAKGVAAPIVGATNARHFDDAVKSVDLELSCEEVAFLEEPYRAHEISGAVPRPSRSAIGTGNV